MVLADIIATNIEKFDPAMTFIDGVGVGGPVVDLQEVSHITPHLSPLIKIDVWFMRLLRTTHLHYPTTITHLNEPINNRTTNTNPINESHCWHQQ
jgi:hypothetical protein